MNMHMLQEYSAFSTIDWPFSEHMHLLAELKSILKSSSSQLLNKLSRRIDAQFNFIRICQMLKRRY